MYTTKTVTPWISDIQGSTSLKVLLGKLGAIASQYPDATIEGMEDAKVVATITLTPQQQKDEWYNSVVNALLAAGRGPLSGDTVQQLLESRPNV